MSNGFKFGTDPNFPHTNFDRPAAALLYKAKKGVKVGEEVDIILEIYSGMVKLSSKSLVQVMKDIKFIKQVRIHFESGEVSGKEKLMIMEYDIDHEVLDDFVVVKMNSELSGKIECVMCKGSEKELVAIVEYHSEKFCYNKSFVTNHNSGCKVVDDTFREIFGKVNKKNSEFLEILKSDKGLQMIDRDGLCENMEFKLKSDYKRLGGNINLSAYRLTHNVASVKLKMTLRDKTGNLLTAVEYKPLEKN